MSFIAAVPLLKIAHLIHS